MKQISAERALLRRALIHHRSHEESLERMLAHLVEHATHTKCKCRTCRAVRELAAELRSA